VGDDSDDATVMVMTTAVTTTMQGDGDCDDNAMAKKQWRGR